MSFLRFLMLMSLVVWVGGIIFFATLAPTLFSVLPSRHLAGSVVAPTLTKLHWMGMVSGFVFLISSLIYNRATAGAVHPFAAKHILIVMMLVLTMVSQFGITPKMAALRTSMGEVDALPFDEPARVEFNSLHVWSTRVEVCVLILGLAVTYLTPAQG